MKSKTILLAGAAFAATLASLPASAGPILFQLSGGKSATFTIDSNATPDFFSTGPFGDQISYNGVTGIFGGAPGTASIGFGTSIFAQLNIGGTILGFTQYGGPDLFSIMNGKPAFNYGTFQLGSITSGPATLTIASGAVPEASTWAMLFLGVGMMGATMRYRRRKTTLAFA
jgi:hypothetical protein